MRDVQKENPAVQLESRVQEVEVVIEEIEGIEEMEVLLTTDSREAGAGLAIKSRKRRIAKKRKRTRKKIRKKRTDAEDQGQILLTDRRIDLMNPLLRIEHTKSLRRIKSLSIEEVQARV